MPGAYLWAWDGTNWIKVECDINGYLKVDMSAIHTLLDADEDTGWDVEQAADEDKIHGKVKGVEAFLLDDKGILSLVKQSHIIVYNNLNPEQGIPNNIDTVVIFDTEVADIQGEFDSSLVEGTDDRADGEGANHLIDDTNSQFTPADVGKIVWNRTDDTYAKVTAYNDAGDLTLSAAIFVSGELYVLYTSKFTAKVAGIYLVSTHITYRSLTVGDYYSIKIRKNGATVMQTALGAGTAENLGGSCALSVPLAVGDYIQTFVKHKHGTTRDIIHTATYSGLQITKVA